MIRLGQCICLAFVCALFCTATAMAQAVTPVPIAVPEISPVLEWLLGIVSLVFTGAVPTVTALIANHLKIANTATLNAMVADGASRAAAIAAQEIIASGERLATAGKNHPALQKAVDYVNRAFPDALTKLGATQQQVAGIVLGEFNKLATAPPPVAAPAVPVLPLPAKP